MTVALLLVVHLARTAPPPPTIADELKEPIKPAPEPMGQSGWVLPGTFALAACLLGAYFYPLHGSMWLLIVWPLLLFALLGVLGLSLVRLLLDGRKHRYGLVSGSVTRVKRNYWDRRAGTAEITVDRSAPVASDAYVAGQS